MKLNLRVLEGHDFADIEKTAAEYQLNGVLEKGMKKICANASAEFYELMKMIGYEMESGDTFRIIITKNISTHTLSQ